MHIYRHCGNRIVVTAVKYKSPVSKCLPFGSPKSLFNIIAYIVRIIIVIMTNNNILFTAAAGAAHVAGVAPRARATDRAAVAENRRGVREANR